MAARSKQSAGILVYRLAPPAPRDNPPNRLIQELPTANCQLPTLLGAASLDVLLVHPGGPFWAKKDHGAWFIPKGEINPDEQPLAAAYREFREEVGLDPPAGEPLDLGTVKNKGGKLIYGWALAGDLDLTSFHSNTFELEWPPRSGKKREFPEVDQARYFSVDEARVLMHPAELPLVERLLRLVGERLQREPPDIA